MERTDLGPVGAIFFKEGGTVYFKNVIDSRSAVGPREATRADADLHPAEFAVFEDEHGKVKLPGDADEQPVTDADAEARQRELDEAEAKRAQAADDAQRAKQEQHDAGTDLKNTERAVKQADAELREQKEAREKADQAAHAKAKGR